MWVLDWADDKAYAYTLATKARDSDKEFDFSGHNNSSALTADGTTMWKRGLDSQRQAVRLLHLRQVQRREQGHILARGQ